MATALAVPVNADRINDLGQEGQNALNIWNDAFAQTQAKRAEYSEYLGGYSSAAGGVVAVASTTRDIAFAAAVAVAVVAAAPVVAGGVAAYGTGTLGLAAGSTGLAAFTYTGTGMAMGLLGAGMEGAGREVATLGAQASMAMSDFIRGRTQAADRLRPPGGPGRGMEGMKQGFVDGVLAFAGAERRSSSPARAGRPSANCSALATAVCTPRCCGARSSARCLAASPAPSWAPCRRATGRPRKGRISPVSWRR